MTDNLLSDRPPFISFLRILGMLIIGFGLIGQIVAVIILTLMVDGDLMSALSQPAEHPELRNAILLSQAAGSLVGLILIPWLYLKTSENRDLGIFFNKQPRNIALYSLLILAATVGLAVSISPVVEWNATITFPEWMRGFQELAMQMEKNAEEIIKVITDNMTPVDLAFSLLVVGALTAVGEEIAFRGMLQTELVRAFRNPHLGIWIAAAVFSAFHFQFFGFVPRLLIGAFLGYLYYWSGNLWLAILGHFFNNGLQLVGLYLYQRGNIAFDVEGNTAAPVEAVIPSIVLTIGLLYFIRNHSRRDPSPDHEFHSQL
ncbi:MAG: CPBP family intramembrane metalloprotease [Bacteroidetes bacterium]|nr:CPBP family intramembrane metalloprotease [Bacteroidota bacterium]MBS1976099.1 CPBP family intramembrane metalloprotease [Bacteroidota bacterium]